MHSWWKRDGKNNVSVVFLSHCGLYGYVDCESQAHPEGECTILLCLHSEFDVGSEAVEMM